MGLPECGTDQFQIFLINDPSGERDLAFVILDLIRSLGEEKVTILPFLKEGDQNCRMGKWGMFNDSSFS
jgi:hypothetical protein